MDVFDKCMNFTRAEEAQAADMYPYFTPIQEARGSRIKVKGRNMIMVGSNNYLGLIDHPKVMQAAKDAIDCYGVATCGSRFLTGTIDLHEELEIRLAKFMKKEAALTFSTGYQTNLGIISTIAGKDDAIITDRMDHASIIDACRLSFATVHKFKHNDMSDLERILSGLGKDTGKVIVVDGVFSMEGDLSDLASIVTLAKKFGSRIMVDDAHGIGVMGRNGRGTAEHFGVEADVDLVMGTFSKSFASLGGFLAGEESVIHYLKHNCRTLIFSASMPPPAVAAALAALDIIENEPERRARLTDIYTRMKKEFDALGFDTGDSATAIIPIKIGENEATFRFWRALLDNGVYANTIITPAVSPGESLIRTSYMATHTDEELDQVLEVFEKVGKEFGLI